MGNASDEGYHYHRKRHFNSIKINKGNVVKKTANVMDSDMLSSEINWYKFAISKNYESIPRIIDYDPFTMQLIDGKHPDLIKIDKDGKEVILSNIFNALVKMHKLSESKYDKRALDNVLIEKTKFRIKKALSLIGPLREEYYIINGKKIGNIGRETWDVVENIVHTLKGSRKFNFIHGDPTFSNIIITKTDNVVFIDPRGYFGGVAFYGESLYDYAKLYYSTIGNYDSFIRGHYRLSNNCGKYKLAIMSNGWEFLEERFNEELGNKLDMVKMMHALIWLSLSGYVVDDKPSALFAYLHGLELLQPIINST